MMDIQDRRREALRELHDRIADIQQDLVALIRERSAASGYIDFDGQPDDVVLAEAEANAELLRIVFDAAHW